METKCCYGRFRDLFQLLKKLWFVYFYLIEIFPYKTKFCLRSSQCAPLWFFLFFLSFHLLLGNEILCKKVEKCIQGLKKVTREKLYTRYYMGPSKISLMYIQIHFDNFLWAYFFVSIFALFFLTGVVFWNLTFKMVVFWVWLSGG